MKRTRTGATRSLAGVALAAALLGVVGCGGATPNGAEDQTDAAAGFVPATSGAVSIYTWSDYLPLELLDRFEEETGIRATIDFYENNESLMSKLEISGGTGYDVVVPSDYAVKAMIEKGLLTKFSALDLPNGKYIAEEAKNVYYDPQREYSAPYMYGSTGFSYDSSLLAEGQEGPKSWYDYFTLGEPFAGDIGILNDEFDGVNAALRAVGAAPCTNDPEELQAALDLLLGLKPKVKTILSDAVADRLGVGENTAGMIWNGDSHRAWRLNQNIVYVYATEGLSLFEDNWVIPSGAANVPQALTFINWMLDPKNAAEAANYVGFSAQLDGIEEYLDEDMKADPAIVPPADAKLEMIPACDNETMNKYTQIWESFKG
ncbi:MAG: spermidine/putrescine ABC transporter substrate-binding protein [Bifidobacteriaceae bacterium]|jgi:spermidine/putrescine transport system substrate-binding protein|nr:spermidine/putrescine ABC transporter substrate-binding protein [Bifidobacteriaceae bacterium]